MTDVVLTPAQVRSLAFIALAHPHSDIVIYPPIGGAVGVLAGGELYTINPDGTPDVQAVAA